MLRDEVKEGERGTPERPAAFPEREHDDRGQEEAETDLHAEVRHQFEPPVQARRPGRHRRQQEQRRDRGQALREEGPRV